MWPGHHIECICRAHFEVYRPLRFFIYSIINCRIRGSVARLGTHFVPHSLGFVLMSASEYEVDRTTGYWVKAYISCIHYVPLWPWLLNYFCPKLSHVPQTWGWIYVLNYKFKDIFISEIWGHLMQIFVVPFVDKQLCHGNHFVRHSLGHLHLIPKYELDRTTRCWVITILDWTRCVTLWPWHLISWPSSHVTWRHLGVKSLFQVWTGYGVRTTTLLHWPPACTTLQAATEKMDMLKKRFPYQNYVIFRNKNFGRE